MSAPAPLPLALPPIRYLIADYVDELVPYCGWSDKKPIPADALTAARKAIADAYDYWLARCGMHFCNETPVGEFTLPGEDYGADVWTRLRRAELRLLNLAMDWIEADGRRRKDEARDRKHQRELAAIRRRYRQPGRVVA